MHLYIDTFITDIPLHGSNQNYNKPLALLESVRNGCYTYRNQQKKDIFKYSLASYAPINWSSVTIIFNCENKDHEPEIHEFAKNLFPSAYIATERSDNRQKFLARIKEIGDDESWIFFSPNNDHPIISNNLIDFRPYLSEADSLYSTYPNHIISVNFSHYTESVNSIRKNKYLYGYYGNSPKIISETENSFHVEFPAACLDSLFIYKRKDLIQFFGQDTNNGRVVRLEDLNDYRSSKYQQIVITPKIEICRHYDGYLHTVNLVDKYIQANQVPPLFIPDGFFESNIKIKSNHSKNTDGHVNIADTASGYSFENNDYPDLICTPDDLPYFWKERISSTDEVSVQRANPTPLPASQLLQNPWAKYDRIFKILSPIFSAKRIRKILHALHW